MAVTKRGRVPTADELQQLALLRRRAAEDVKAGRVHAATLERMAQRDRKAAQWREFRRLSEPAPDPQRRLGD